MDDEISENDLIALEKSAIPENTSRATTYGIKKFVEWLNHREHKCDFATIPAEEINSLLRKFYAELKAKKPGQTLTPSTLACIRAAIHRYITGAPYNRSINIIQDREFIAANKIFEARCKLYFKAGNPPPKHYPPIEEGDMQRIGVYFASNRGHPRVLVQAVWFNLCLFYGRRAREGWAEMKKKTSLESRRIHKEESTCTRQKLR